MKPRNLSLREILLLTISTLTLLIALLVLQEVYVQWQQLQKIESLKEATLFSDTLFEATDKLSVERDIAYAMLYAPDTDDITDLQSRLAESRRKTDAAFADTLASLTHYTFPELDDLRKDVEAHMAGIRILRRQIDQAVLLPKKQREAALSAHWYGEVTGLITETQDLWSKFIRHFTDINPIVTQHLRYKHSLLLISDYTARERSLIGRLLVENADPTPEETAQLLRWQGMIELSWQSVQLLAEQSGLYTAIGPYLKDAQSQYMTTYDMVRDIFFLPTGIRHSGKYPISVDLWFELSTQSSETLDALKEASKRAKHAYVQNLENEGKKSIALHLALLLLALGLCFYCFRIINRRVIRPINAMIEALVDTTQGKSVSFVPHANTQDEIGKLAGVLNAFRETGERYRALVEASSQIIWTWRPEGSGNMQALFDWWEKTTGQPGEEMLPFGWLEVVHPEDRERAGNIWSNASANGVNFDMEYRLRTRNGQYRWVYIRGVAIKDMDGSVREFVGALADITERKTAEAELAAYTHALERSNKELDDFAYIASHDLKEPLRGIHNHSRFLLEDNQDKLDPESVRRLGRLIYLSERMERLVNDLLYFSRLGRQELAIQPTDINEIIHDIENTLDMFLAERHASIIVPQKLPVIICDKTRVTEAFRNLIVNAVKYNDKPEKTVEIGFLPSQKSPDGTLLRNVFYVRDNGKGIPSEFYEEIFRIFKRLQSSKDSLEEGTGAGLTFVKKIIERHGGRIWLESVVGQGTIFYFTLGEH